MRIDDNINEVLQLVTKTTKLTATAIKNVMKWYLQHKKENDKFKKSIGQTDMITLTKTENTVKFLPEEIDRDMMRRYAKLFRKYNVHFAIEKQETGKYRIAFAGRNAETIEYAMFHVVQKMDRDQERSILNKIKKFQQQLNESAKDKQKIKKREKDMSR